MLNKQEKEKNIYKNVEFEKSDINIKIHSND